jgi:hypothetical protein
MDHRTKGGGIVYLASQTLWNQVYITVTFLYKHFLGANIQIKIISSDFHIYTTIIPWYKSNRLTSFRLYEIHKLIPVFQFTSQFSLIQAPSSHKPIVVPGASSWEVMGN